MWSKVDSKAGMMGELTHDEKLQYIERHLDSLGVNFTMGIRRIGPGMFEISGGEFIMHTGVGGCYDYIRMFGTNMRKVHQGFISQVENMKPDTYTTLTRDMLENILKDIE